MARRDPDGRTAPSQLSGVHSNSMSLNVIRMSVATDLVIGDQHLRPAVADHRHQFVRGLQQIRRPEIPSRSTSRAMADRRSYAIPESRYRPSPPSRMKSVTPRISMASLSSPSR